MAFDILYLYHAEKNLSTKKEKEGQDPRFFKKSKNAGWKNGFKDEAQKEEKENCCLNKHHYMLAKKFRLPIWQWMRDKNKRTITRKGNFFIVKTAPNNLKLNRFGTIISSRALKKATQRNRLKRMIFEFIRLNKLSRLSDKDVLIIVQPSASQAKELEMKKELNLLIV